MRGEKLLDPFLDELGEHHSGGAKLLYVKKGVRGKSYREGVQALMEEASGGRIHFMFNRIGGLREDLPEVSDQEWWAICEPMQDPVPERREGEWWHEIPEVFHTD